MTQLRFTEIEGQSSQKIVGVVNVASVPQRSPFRCPGGKTWLVPFIRSWLRSNKTRPTTFIEPFAGGASVGLSVAFDGLADHVVLVELDARVAAVWQTVLGDDVSWLVDRILSFEMDEANVDAALARDASGRKEQAFQAILRNRINRGGILARGAGRVKQGENGKGLRSRWYPQTLVRRIHAIHSLRDRLSFIHGDGITALQQWETDLSAIFFIDPPYTASQKRAGARLYRHTDVDHELVFRIAARVAGDFVLSYDESDEIRAMAARHGLTYESVRMKSTHHVEMRELLVSRDLGWLRSQRAP